MKDLVKEALGVIVGTVDGIIQAQKIRREQSYTWDTYQFPIPKEEKTEDIECEIIQPNQLPDINRK